jgi:hypothetical protein
VKKAAWTVLAVAALAVGGTTPAYAGTGVLCKIIPWLCPPPPSGGTGGSSKVPEPETLTFLAIGAAAAAVAARRRSKK